ncbi:MAG: HAMP domain-containing sensor histidine kinase [Paracoccaceae bacterium]
MNKPAQNYTENEATAPAGRPALSLKARLGIGAALLGAGTLLTAVILWFGMNEVAKRLDTALASETRVARYATLSTQTSTFLVVATEAIQTGIAADLRADRIAPVADQLSQTFDQLHSDVEKAVQQARSLGLDEQSRYGTQSLGLARMQAMLDNTLRGLAQDTPDKDRLRAHVDTFASSFDTLLSQAVNTELVFRNAILSGIDSLRLTLTRVAFAIAALTLLLVAAFYLMLVRPQFRRLDRLQTAASQIGQEDFEITLPATRNDEIGRLYNETNRMAAALSTRQSKIQAEWHRLNETIAERTEALRAANDSLAKIDENRRHFFADISHELRTPLTVILMEAQIAQQDPKNAEKAFDIIQARAAKLNRRIDDLLRVARSDSGQLALDPQSVPLPALMQDIIQELQPELDTAGMRVTMSDIPDQSLICDRNWIRQVLVSLARNAIRHARDGQMLAFAVKIQGADAHISVTDNGPGIETDQQQRIFDRFVQGGGANAQGFGVGLSLARWVSEAHGGQIDLISPLPPTDALGQAPGTKILVRLPLAGP